MEYVELVVKMPEELYKRIQSVKSVPDIPGIDIVNAITNLKTGTILPKGHSKLFDEKEINTVINGVFNVSDKCSPKTFLDVIDSQCIEIIEADDAEGEEIWKR